MAGSNQNAFSVDVEDYFHVSAFENVIDRQQWEILPSRVEANTERLLEFLDKRNVTATFFVLGWVAERHPNLVRKISDSGHEIGCHGYSHRKIYDQSVQTFSDETRRAKRLLEDCIGTDVIGYRAASFSITEDSMWALDVLVNEGFLYDSSIYPVWHDNYGIPGSAADPTILTTPKASTIVEFPLSTQKILGVPIPVSGGGYFRLYPYSVTKILLDKIQNSGRVINFYCHPWELDTTQPRFDNTPWRSRFRHYNNIEKFEIRLERLMADFDFSSCRNVLISAKLLGEELRS